MIEYRPIAPNDIDLFWTFLNLLDTQTDFMMYEPNERAARTSLSQLKSDIQNNEDFIHIAIEDGKIVGFIHAERGKFNRTRHTAYIITGILQSHRGQGIGTALFERLDKWAAENRITRLELTVECSNEAAIHLYKKSGFTVEGTRSKSMYVNGRYADEYYMAKIL
ncbi:MAG: GNAT family N-acetyltransferase [Oscillospiraceae bacterium]|nr:GNAT family N-acetyltransferase [Oscillospiraceae bacterium]